MRTKRTVIIAGSLLATAGTLGVAPINFIRLDLGTAQSILYLFTGGVAVCFGILGGPRASRVFCLLLGSFYTVLALAGIGLGGPRLTIIPGQLIFETLDHLFHLIVGALLLAAGCQQRMATLIAPHEPTEFVRIFQHPNPRLETPDGPVLPVQGDKAGRGSKDR